MNKKEFTQLTSLQLSDEEYAAVEKVYMMVENVGKQNFCNMWKKMGDNAREYMISMARKATKEINTLQETIDNNALTYGKHVAEMGLRMIKSQSDAVSKELTAVLHMVEDGYQAYNQMVGEINMLLSDARANGNVDDHLYADVMDATRAMYDHLNTMTTDISPVCQKALELTEISDHVEIETDPEDEPEPGDMEYEEFANKYGIK